MIDPPMGRSWRMFSRVSSGELRASLRISTEVDAVKDGKLVLDRFAHNQRTGEFVLIWLAAVRGHQILDRPREPLDNPMCIFLFLALDFCPPVHFSPLSPRAWERGRG